MSGPKALEILRSETFDVAVLDVRMPEMDGLTVLDRCKDDYPSMEVILLTGYASVQTGVEGMRKGAYDFLIKPANMDVLVARINAAFAKKLAHEELEREKKIADGY
jgi:DNA-binding NtrC family response regulator